MAYRLKSHTGHCGHSCEVAFARAASALGVSVCQLCGEAWDHWSDNMFSPQRLGTAAARRTPPRTGPRGGVA